MNSKKNVWIGMIVGSTIGSYIPNLWGAGVFSISTLFISALGALIGIWLGFKLSR